MKPKLSQTQAHFLSDDSNSVSVYMLSLITALLLLITSAISILNRDVVYPTDALQQTFLANDVVNITIGLPLLLGALWLSWRGKLLGLLFWPGALMYIVYNYTSYLFGTPLSGIYLLYMSLVSMSGYTMLGLISTIHAVKVKQQLAGVVPERLSGGILIGLGLLNLVRVFIVMIAALIDHSSLPPTEASVLLADFFLSPAWIIGGVMLWQRKALGYVTGLSLLFQTSMLFIGLIVFMLIQPLLTAAPLAIFDVLVVALMGMICFVPFGIFIRKVGFSL